MTGLSHSASFPQMGYSSTASRAHIQLRFPSRELNSDSGAVTTGAISINAAAVRQAPKTLEGLHDNAMRCWSLKIRNKSNATSVVLFTPVKSYRFPFYRS